MTTIGLMGAGGKMGCRLFPAWQAEGQQCCVGTSTMKLPITHSPFTIIRQAGRLSTLTING